MTEDFYLARRFGSLEEAGQAYFPIQELLRAEEATDLSIYRFQLGDDALVALVGEQPQEAVLAAIGQALSAGQPVSLPDEIVAWMYQRREQGAQQEGFSEEHYTRETGPRTQVRRGKVEMLQVTWDDRIPTREDASGTIADMQTGAEFFIPAQFSGVCDWCTAELAPPVAAIHSFTVELEYPDGFKTVTGGKWATCKMCQGRLRLKPRETQVSFDAVDRLWRLHGSRYLGADARRLRIHTFYHEDSEEGE